MHHSTMFPNLAASTPAALDEAFVVQSSPILHK